MVASVLYSLAVLALLAGVAYSLLSDPRPCGMDDVLTSCGSGARYGPAFGGIVSALILAYVGRALSHSDK